LLGCCHILLYKFSTVYILVTLFLFVCFKYILVGEYNSVLSIFCTYLVQTHTGLPTGKQVFAPNQGTHITAWFVDKNNRRSIPAHQSDSHMHNMDVVQVIIKANICCMCVLMHLRSGPHTFVWLDNVRNSCWNYLNLGQIFEFSSPPLKDVQEQTK
jgi:hypothetical protein